MKSNNFFTNFLVKVRSGFFTSNREPQVQQKCDRNGNKYWQVRDLYNNRSYTFGSESDVRAWLENRHYRFN